DRGTARLCGCGSPVTGGRSDRPRPSPRYGNCSGASWAADSPHHEFTSREPPGVSGRCARKSGARRARSPTSRTVIGAKEIEMTLLREAIGDSLRRARLAQHRTLREVSTSARVSLGYLSEVERGRKEASSELLAAICQALDVPLSRVLWDVSTRSEEHTSELQSRENLVCRLLLEKKKT